MIIFKSDFFLYLRKLIDTCFLFFFLTGEPNEDVVVAESGGEGEESDDEDDEWNYFKGQSGVAVIEKPSDLVR